MLLVFRDWDIGRNRKRALEEIARNLSCCSSSSLRVRLATRESMPALHDVVVGIVCAMFLEKPSVSTAQSGCPSNSRHKRKILLGGNPQETQRANELLGLVDAQTTNPPSIAKNPHIRIMRSSEAMPPRDTASLQGLFS